jgi:thermolabile hemolysin
MLPKRFIAGLTAAVLFAGLRAWPAPPPYEALYAFGDSLTDTGREPAEPALHYNGRWSNGPLWVEYLSTNLGFAYDPSKNLARSGAQTDDTYQQVLAFVPTQDISRALFVVWAGGNDFLQEYDKNGFDNSSWDRQIAYSVSSLSNAVLRLRDKGARFILVPNTVDVTRIPLLNKLFAPLKDYLRGKVQQFNRGLAEALDRISADHPDLVLYRVDFYTRVDTLIVDAGPFGFTETEIDAISDVTLLDKSFDGPGANYVFWDPIHPSTKAHRLIAGWFQNVVAPQPIHATLRPAGGQLELSLTGAEIGRSYSIRRTTDLANWSVLQTVMALDTSVLMSLTNDQAAAFFTVAPAN